MRRYAAPCPISANLPIEDFLEKYEAAAIPRARNPACRIMTDSSIEGGRALLGEEFHETSLRIAGRDISAVGADHGQVRSASMPAA